MKNPTKKNQGFTLIELLTVITIIGILFGLAFKAGDVALKTEIIEIALVEAGQRGHREHLGIAAFGAGRSLHEFHSLSILDEHLRLCRMRCGLTSIVAFDP